LLRLRVASLVEKGTAKDYNLVYRMIAAFGPIGFGARL